ncbi:MAG: hypothetical protein ACRBBW_15735 [Cellvibrionaceae bacterium]
MAGEFRVAQQQITEAMETADAEGSMSRDAMGRALLTELLAQLSKDHSPETLKDMIDYQLENLGSDSFVVTRGC